MRRLILWASCCLFATFMQAQTCDLDFENFENASNANPPGGWIRDGSYIGSLNPFSGSNHAGFNDLNDILIVEPLTCPGEISFYWRASGSSSDYDINIDWSIDDGATWTTVHTITLNGSNSPTNYSQAVVDLPEFQFTPPFEGVLIRFHQVRRNSGSFYLDDFCVSAGTCVVTPTQLTFSDLQAGCLAKGVPFSLTVCGTDASGFVDQTFSESIHLSLASGAGTLGGTTGQMPTNGCVIFNDLTLSQADDFTLSAVSTSLTGSSSSIAIEDTCPLVEQLKIMTYNLLNFPDGRNDCGGSNIVVSARWDTLRKIVQYVQPDVLLVCELQTELGANLILNDALNVFGTTHYAKANFVLNQSSGATQLNNMFFYNTQKLTLKSQSEVQTDLRDIGKYTVFVHDSNLALHNDTTWIDFYDAHLKAGNTATDISRRAAGCTELRNYVDALPTERNAVMGGDFNFYTSSESGYQTLLTGTFPFNDPVNRPGAWDNDVNFSDIHTQSTRASGSNQMDCGATGGMDSRFDFLLTSSSILNGTKNVQYINNSYTELGNDGNLFNLSINDASNSSGLPDSVLTALHFMSDHLPVLMDLEVTFPIILPIELLSFSGKKEGKAVRLAWQAVLDEQHDSFSIEFSRNGRNFQTVGITNKVSETFSFAHYPQNTRTAYYRLKQVDKDGQFTFSEIVVIDFSEATEFTIWSNGNQFLIESSSEIGDANIMVSNLLGQRIGRNKIKIQKGINKLELTEPWQNQFLIFQIEATETGETWSQKGWF